MNDIIKHRAKIILCCGTLLLLAGFYLWNSGYRELVQKCKRVELGTSEEQAVQVLGPPGRKRISDRQGRKVRSLEYDAPAIAAMAPYVVIDDLTGHVIEVACDDEHHLRQ